VFNFSIAANIAPGIPTAGRRWRYVTCFDGTLREIYLNLAWLRDFLFWKTPAWLIVC